MVSRGDPTPVQGPVLGSRVRLWPGRHPVISRPVRLAYKFQATIGFGPCSYLAAPTCIWRTPTGYGFRNAAGALAGPCLLPLQHAIAAGAPGPCLAAVSEPCARATMAEQGWGRTQGTGGGRRAQDGHRTRCRTGQCRRSGHSPAVATQPATVLSKHGSAASPRYPKPCQRAPRARSMQGTACQFCHPVGACLDATRSCEPWRGPWFGRTEP